MTISSFAKSSLAVTAAGGREIEGRNVVRYENDCPKAWGYEGGMRQYFYVAEPKVKREKQPLLVCLHSAGGTGESEMPSNVTFTAKAGDDFVGLMPNSKFASDWWWGDEVIKKNSDEYNNRLTAAEKRVLATIEWVAAKYNVDRDRIYLRGISMGGSGTLGLGIAHGDVFAAMMAGVPAGAHHMLYRAEMAKDVCPPPALVFFSQTDDWSKEMGEMLRAVNDRKYGFVCAWGPWGHINHYEMMNPAAYAYPWLSIRRNEAYPVFLNTSTDQKWPGCKSTGPDQIGQINAYFRWSNLKDTKNEFAMQFRLVTSRELDCNNIELPEKAQTDVTLRRLQNFNIRKNIPYKWTLEQAGHLINSGQFKVGEEGLITIRDMEITAKPVRLTIDTVAK